MIREATAEDWPAIWPFFHQIIAAGESFGYDTGMPEEQARSMWLDGPPSRTTVAIGSSGEILGSANMHPNVETNERAVGLYESLGFEVVGTVPEAFEHPQHGYVGLHVMHRRL
jgi:L-amino acid N-acyltransferase YncA